MPFWTTAGYQSLDPQTISAAVSAVRARTEARAEAHIQVQAHTESVWTPFWTPAGYQSLDPQTISAAVSAVRAQAEAQEQAEEEEAHTIAQSQAESVRMPFWTTAGYQSLDPQTISATVSAVKARAEVQEQTEAEARILAQPQIESLWTPLWTPVGYQSLDPYTVSATTEEAGPVDHGNKTEAGPAHYAKTQAAIYNAVRMRARARVLRLQAQKAHQEIAAAVAHAAAEHLAQYRPQQQALTQAMANEEAHAELRASFEWTDISSFPEREKFILAIVRHSGDASINGIQSMTRLLQDLQAILKRPYKFCLVHLVNESLRTPTLTDEGFKDALRTIKRLHLRPIIVATGLVGLPVLESYWKGVQALSWPGCSSWPIWLAAFPVDVVDQNKSMFTEVGSGRNTRYVYALKLRNMLEMFSKPQPEHKWLSKRWTESLAGREDQHHASKRTQAADRRVKRNTRRLSF